MAFREGGVVDTLLQHRPLVNYINRVAMLSRLLTMDLIFIFISYFIFIFLFFSFSIFRTTRVRGYQSRCHISHNLMAQSQNWSQDIREGSRRFWNKVISYSMDNTCWPHVILTVIQGRVHSSQHGPWVLVYKVDYSVLGTLSSSLVLLNTRVVS